MKGRVLELENLLGLLPDAIVVVDGAGRIVFANSAVTATLGYLPDNLIGESLDRLIPEEFRRRHEAHYRRFRAQGKPTPMGARPLLSALHESGKTVPISISIANLDFDDERYSVAVMRDAGELHTEISTATEMAETDALTGIASRLRLSRVIQSALADAKPFGLLFMDLRKFKPFNDEYGHDTGDRVLQVVAKRLQAQVRSADLAARFGGDEFVVFFDGLTDIGLLEERAATIADSLTRTFHIGDLASSIGVNIGGSIYPRDGQTEEELLKVADQKMYLAKQSGSDYHF